MSLTDFIAEVRAADYTSPDVGDDYSEPMHQLLSKLYKAWPRAPLERLAAYDFSKDQEKIRIWFNSFFGTRPPIPVETRTLMIWFIGAGPNYPMSFTGFADSIAPVEDDLYETDALGVEIWPNEEETPIRQLEREHKTMSREEMLRRWGIAALEEYCYAPFPTLLSDTIDKLDEEDPDLQAGKFCLFDVESTLMLFYAAHVVSWIATEFRDNWLKTVDELHFIYGISSDDATIAGRLSRAEGWQSVADLLAT